MRGTLDEDLTAELEEELECLCEEGVTSVVLDVRELRALEPLGAQAIAAGGAFCRQRGRDLQVISGSPDVEQLLSRVGAGDLLVTQPGGGRGAAPAGLGAAEAAVQTTTVREL